MFNLTYTYRNKDRTTGPASFPLKQSDNNGQLTSVMAMPQKFYPSSGGNVFSMARHTYSKDAGGGQGYHDSSEYIALKKANAIGKSSTKTGLPKNAPLSFRSQDRTYRNSAIARVRAGGCTAPKKKGAIANTFQSGGRSRLTGTGNRQIYA